jgi:translation initiation factor IF-1
MSHSRKHVIQKTLEDDPLPTPTQKIVRVVEARGDNIYSVEHPTGEKVLCVRPAKFKNVLWIKRGDFLIIEPVPSYHLQLSSIFLLHFFHCVFSPQNVLSDGFDLGT